MAVGRHILNSNGNYVGTSLNSVAAADVSFYAEVRFTDTILAGASNSIFTTLLARHVAANDNQYGLRLRWYQDGVTTLQLYSYVGGVLTNLGGSPITISGVTAAANTWYSLRLECIGTTIQGKFWLTGSAEPGTWNISVTDSALATAARVGFFAGNESGTGTQSIQYDNVLVTAPGGGGGGGGTGPLPGDLPVGGSAALRGVKSFVILTPNVTAGGGSVASVHSARDAAGAGGKVHITANVTGTLVMSVANQTWQVDPGVTITGIIEMQASGCTYEGGNLVGGFHAPRSPKAHNITMRNVAVSGNGFANASFTFEGNHDNVSLINCTSTNPGADFVKAWYDQAGDGSPNGFLCQNCIFIRDGSWGTRASHGFGSQGPSMMSGADGGSNTRFQYNFNLYNTYIDNGSGSQGGFGVEWWGHETSPIDGRGIKIQYCDLRGGQDHLISAVRSRDPWVHHTKFTLNPAYSCYESAGTNHLRGFFEDNDITWSGGGNGGAVIYHNSGATGLTVRRNNITNVTWIVNGCCNGGGYQVLNNCTTGSVGNISGGSFAVANTVTGNGPC